MKRLVDRDHEAQNPTERQIVIFGTAETVKRAKEMLDQLLNGGSVAALRGPGQQMQQPQMLINVPGDLVGLLIGRGGDTIKNIQQMCGCNVKIDQNNGAAVRVVTVTGPQENWAYAEELIQEKVQGAGEVQSSSSAAASAYPAAATAGYAYYDANGGSTSAQAYADYYAQYYQQQQASAASGSATGANAGAEGEDKKEGEASNANSADYAAYYQQYYQAYASAMGGDPNADYAAYYQQYYNAANSDKKEDGDKDNKEDADKKKDKEDNKEAEDK